LRKKRRGTDGEGEKAKSEGHDIDAIMRCNE